MYEKHIEALLDARCDGGNPTEALDAAIELMRAAEPKDEAAERQHCMRAAAEISDGSVSGQERVAALLMRERAAARAEGVEQAKAMLEIADMLKGVWRTW